MVLTVADFRSRCLSPFRTMPRRTISVARHEAAHAVVGCYLGLRLKAVKVTPNDDEKYGWEGYTHFKFAPTKRLAFGVMCAAGAAGDHIHGFDRASAWAGDVRLANAHGFTCHEIVMLRDLAGLYLKGPCKTAWRQCTAALLERDLTGSEVRALVIHKEPLEIE